MDIEEVYHTVDLDYLPHRFRYDAYRQYHVIQRIVCPIHQHVNGDVIH
jgi:hypothetical protein